MWTEFFDAIYLLNLKKRTDRLVQAIDELNKWDIVVDVVEAIEDAESGARGLRDTCVQVFQEAIDKGYQNILIFEDDVVFLNDVTDTMEKVVKQLPESYDICFLGCQITAPIVSSNGKNLLKVQRAYSTHAWAISRKCIEFILEKGFGYPIDNWLVSEVEAVRNETYCVYPILATQREGFSDIGHARIAWDEFISKKFYHKINEFKQKGGVI